MARKEKQIGNVAIFMLPVVIGSLLPILTLPIFTRILTKEDFGVWALAQVYAIFVSGIANFGLTIGYERNFFEYKEVKDRAALLYSTLLFVTISLLIYGCVTYLLKEQLARLIIGSADYADILFWTYCSTSVVGLKTYYLTYLKNTENAKDFAIYMIEESVLTMLFSLFMVVYLRVGVIGLVWGQLLGSSVVFSLLSLRFFRKVPVHLNWEPLRYSLKLSWPLTPRIFFGIIGKQFDKYMIGLLNTVGGVGIYSIGQRVANIVFTVMVAFQNVYSPQVYKRMFELGDEGAESIGPYLTPFLYVSISICLLISSFSEEILYLLTPDSYHGAVEIVIIFSMLYGSYFFGQQPQLIFAKKAHIVSLLTAINIGLNVLINIPFIMMWGVIGAAWGTLLAGLIYGAASFVVSQHYFKIHWEYKKIGCIFAIFFGAAITMILLRSFDVAYGVRLIIKSLFLGGYFFLGMKMNVLTKQNFHIVRNMILPVKDKAVINENK